MLLLLTLVLATVVVEVVVVRAAAAVAVQRCRACDAANVVAVGVGAWNFRPWTRLLSMLLLKRYPLHTRDSDL
jgi:hypothetical protein